MAIPSLLVYSTGVGYHNHGFTYQAWVPLEHSQRADASGDITFELDWPGLEPPGTG